MVRERKKDWKQLNGRQKLRQIWDYYKLPLFLLALLIYLVSYVSWRQITAKEKILYTALINITPEEELVERLTTGFLEAEGYNEKKQEETFYSNWYVTDNDDSSYYEYVYATKMKILAAIQAEQLDVVLMNQEAFDAFAQNGYLADLKEFLPKPVYEAYQDVLRKNVEIVEDNAREVQLRLAEEYEAVTKEYDMALEITDAACFQGWEWSGEIFLGVLKNTPRKEAVTNYINYIYKQKKELT